MNKVTTVGYFIKRLRDSGYVCDRIFSNYSDIDCRCWTVVVDPGKTSIFITCINNRNEMDEEYFEIHDSGQFIPENFKLCTSSIEIIIGYLVEFGINNKSKVYTK